MRDHPISQSRWWAAAGIRAIRTIAQTAVAMIGTELVGVLDVAWTGVASVSLVAGAVSVLTSLAGLPELDEEEEEGEADLPKH